MENGLIHILIPAANFIALVWVISHLRATRFEKPQRRCVVTGSEQCLLLSKELGILCPACMEKVRVALGSSHAPTP